MADRAEQIAALLRSEGAVPLRFVSDHAEQIAALPRSEGAVRLRFGTAARVRLEVEVDHG